MRWRQTHPLTSAGICFHMESRPLYAHLVGLVQGRLVGVILPQVLKLEEQYGLGGGKLSSDLISWRPDEDTFKNSR